MSIKAKLSTFDATMIVVSLVIGIGIFRTPAMVASSSGTTFIFFTAWILGGFISLLGALTFAEIGSRFPKPGAFYKVVAESYHPSVAFMLNWSNVTIVNGAGGAGVALIGAEYLIPIIFPESWRTPVVTQWTAAGLVLFLLLINYIGIKTGAWAQNILTVVKIGMILMLGFVAFSFAGTKPPEPVQTLTHEPFWMALGIGLISVFYTYGGYQCTLNFGGDIKQPERNMPRAIFFGIAIIIGLYLLINLAYVSVLGIQGVAGAKLVAAEVARVCFGQSAYLLVSIAIFLSALGFVNVTLMQIPRSYYAMAQDGALPPIFMKVNPRTQTQEFTLLFFGGTILVSIVFLGTFERLVNYVMIFDTLNNALVASTIFVLRRRGITSPNGAAYKVPFYPFLPGFFVLFLLFITGNIIATQPESLLIGGCILLAGYPVFLLLRKLSHRPGKTVSASSVDDKRE
ncbi:MAG: amino acid permease [Ignavibacteriales bacterium]|nr:amino acid permease [Ignavibacteriales bacterium]